MELDEMKQAWRVLDRRLERQHGLDLAVFRERKRDKARRRLRPLRWGQLIQIVAGAVLMLLFAPYWVEHLDSPHLALYGLALHAYGLLFVVTAARNLYLQRFDYGAPVLDIQRRIAELRRWRLTEAVLYGVTGCFIWIPLLLIGFQQLGADLWLEAPAVVWSFLVSGLACVGLFFGVIRWSRRPGWERLRRALEDSSIGQSVLSTQSLLAELAHFERD